MKVTVLKKKVYKHWKLREMSLWSVLALNSYSHIQLPVPSVLFLLYLLISINILIKQIYVFWDIKSSVRRLS